MKTKTISNYFTQMATTLKGKLKAKFHFWKLVKNFDLLQHRKSQIKQKSISM